MILTIVRDVFLEIILKLNEKERLKSFNNIILLGYSFRGTPT